MGASVGVQRGLLDGQVHLCASGARVIHQSGQVDGMAFPKKHMFLCNGGGELCELHFHVCWREGVCSILLSF